MAARKLAKQEQEYSKLAVRGGDDENDIDDIQQRQLEKGAGRPQRKRAASPSQTTTQIGDDDNDFDNDDEDELYSPDTGVAGMFFPRRRTGTLFMAALVVMTALFLLIVYLVVQRNQIKRSLDNVARSWRDAFPDDVLAMIDDHVDPCDDFHAFACGKWIAETEIPPEKASVYASFTRVEDANEATLRAIIAENWPYISELYNSCMNVSAIDAIGAAPLQAGLEQIATVQSKHELFVLAGELAQTGPDYLTGLGVSPDAKDATVYALYASQTGLTLPDRSYYLDSKRFDDVESDLHTFIAAMFTLTRSSTNATATATRVVAFERALAALFVPKELLTDPVTTYNVVSIQTAATDYPLLLGAYLNGSGIAARVANASTPITTLVVETPAFFQAAEALVAATPLATLQAVLTYKYIADAAALLSTPFRDAVFALFRTKLTGQQQRAPRWKTCLHQTTVHFPTLLGKYFFLQRFDAASEARAIELVTQIERAMRSQLNALPWLDAATRNAALLKLTQVSNLIGHSNQHEHFPFVLTPDQLAQNIQRLAQFKFETTIQKLGTRVDRTEWFMTAAAVNAYYNPSGNQIVFPAGILQPPFFANAQHAAQNYGAIGSIIGHELTHGFDSQGRNYDGRGNLVKWWTNATTREFEARAACLVDQYDAFAVTSVLDTKQTLGHVNGNFTLGENIADNGGVLLAFRAFQHARAAIASGQTSEQTSEQTSDSDRSSAAQQKPTLSTVNAEKLFFVSFAQSFCAKSSDAAMVRRLSTDPHAPEQWRINGVMMNSDAFARTFACPRGANMNPAKKCTLW